MQQKLRDLMTSEHLKSGQLAEMLGINPAGISHILAGRNKPGFDLLQKILRRFPRVNPDWLLLGEGPMYRADYTPTSEPTEVAPLTPQTEPMAKPVTNGSLFASSSTEKMRDDSPAQEIASVASHRSGRVSRIVIFYDDQTFESFTPNK